MSSERTERHVRHCLEHGLRAVLAREARGKLKVATVVEPMAERAVSSSEDEDGEEPDAEPQASASK